MTGIERGRERIAVVRVHACREAKFGGQALTDLGPGLTAVIASMRAVVVLLVQAVAVLRRPDELVDAVADCRIFERPVCAQTLVPGHEPGAVIGGLEDPNALHDREPALG